LIELLERIQGPENFLKDGAGVTDPALSYSAANYTPGISESRSGVSSYYGNDRLGYKTLQTNSSSAVTYQVSYDAFGLQKSATGSTSSPFGFVGAAGYQQDSDSGLMLLGHRYYDPSTGRFLTRDPVNDGSNWYDYVGNNALIYQDPAGLEWWYSQSTGVLYHVVGTGKHIIVIRVGTGFSGAPGHINNPGDAGLHNKGPIPIGGYHIGKPRHKHAHGPLTLPLEPDPGNHMHGRGGLLIHGDKIGHPGTGSTECIILPKPIRKKIAASGDNHLTVFK